MAYSSIKIVSLFLLILCIGIAIEQTHAYWWGVYNNYAYPSYVWYGKRQAGFGPSANVGGTFGSGGSENANDGAAQNNY
ncbi:hypothetical protein niasHT_006478 [Heterodera trifolii]|uniref:Uncharacterized protein n=1 Tax=Heterodera trifolii TaxID=157864 RepID=A0ABD2LV82_9BILA